jgi:TRAP-type mannitol/chloroaromatic compound transport system permease large subunit
MSNETLLAIPFFTFMGIVLERSGMAEDLLDTVGQLFGPIRGGLAFAVVLVGALLAATTGVVAASVIAMGLISLPIMLRYKYNGPLASGTIAASGTLAQIVPPSLVLIVMADQLGRSVGDMYVGALYPAEISGGMQKRVSLARSIISEPDLIFFDEPTTGLDPITADAINDLILEMVRGLGAAAVTITHDMASAKKIADEIAMLHEGKIIWRGPAKDVYASGNEYVDQFVNGRADGPIQPAI